MKTKFAATCGNLHQSQRMTKFYDTAQEAADAYPAADYVSQYSNWAEHEKWSREKKGMYAYHQVEV